MLGIIADDFTGATDIADALVNAGFRTTVCIGIPEKSVGQADAYVMALKTRTDPLPAVLLQTQKAYEWLKKQGVRQYYFKYCSTFDSTAEGNIGPVIDLLCDLTGAKFAPVVPTYPKNNRTVYKGYLFVGDVLLSESPMRHHPLTPMTDSNLLRVLSPQTKHKVGLIELDIVHQGANAIKAAQDNLASNVKSVIIDAIEETDLAYIAAANANSLLITGGAALAAHFKGPHPENARQSIKRLSNKSVMLVGSASDTTRKQLRHAAKSGILTYKIDTNRFNTQFNDTVAEIYHWIEQQWQTEPQQPLIIHSAEYADEMAIVEERKKGYGAASMVEKAFAELAKWLAKSGQRDFVVAGGETSGTVVEALGTIKLDIGQDIAPGVVWTTAQTHEDLTINMALKSGNFGAESFFLDAWRCLS